MIVKLLIIVGIVIGGGVLLFPESLNFFSYDFDKTKENLIDVKDDSYNNVDKTVENTFDKITTTIDDTIDTVSNKLGDLNSKDFISAHGLIKEEPVYYGQVFEKDKNKNTCQISVPEMAQIVNGNKELTHILSLENCDFEVNDSVRITTNRSGGGSSSSGKNIFQINSQPNTPSLTNNQPVVDSTPSSLIFDTLSLSTVRHDTNDVQIQYEDTSGGTNSVKVTLRNAEKELFSGIFYASKFETSVNDISDTPHIIEMVVEHAEYGTITSSVFNPAGSFDNNINGVFIKSN